MIRAVGISHGQPRGEGHLEGGGQVDRYSQALQEGATRGYAGRHYVARHSMPSHQASRQAHGDGVTLGAAPSIARERDGAPALHRAVGSTLLGCPRAAIKVPSAAARRADRDLQRGQPEEAAYAVVNSESR